MKANDPIGVFDSGLGGISVLRTLKQEMPMEDVIYFGDSKYNPYGTKTKEEIEERCFTICDALTQHSCKAVIVACNTATSACIPQLRKRYPIDIVGMEPALKVAAELGKQQTIAVWATQLTLQEQKFANLMHRFQDEHTILKVPCPKLVRLVEDDLLSNEDLVRSTLKEYLEQSSLNQLNSIVLGCTHFVFFREILKTMVPSHVQLVDGNLGTVHHLKDLLKQKDLLHQEHQGTITWINTEPDKIEQSKRLLEYRRV